MRLFTSLAVCALATCAAARSPQHVRKTLPKNAKSIRSVPLVKNNIEKRQSSNGTIIPQNANTTSAYIQIDCFLPT